MYSIKTFNAIAAAGLATFSSQYQLNGPQEADAYLIRSVDLLQAQFSKRLKAIVRAGAGYNNIPIDTATAQGIAVFTTPGSNANAVKELVVAMLVAASHNLFAAASYAAANSGADISTRTEREKTQFNGTELLGKTLAVIGVGHVGALVAHAAADLGMRVIGYDPYLTADDAWRIPSTTLHATSLSEAIQQADYVTVHVPKNPDTLNLIGAAEIEAMKPGTILLNFARDGIVDHEAVVTALEGGQLGQYMTDFGDDLINGRPHVTVTPHLGGSTIQAETNGAIQGAHTIMTFLETGNVTNSVNLPTLNVPFHTPYRLTVIHDNVPNMVGQIATYLATHRINIEGMSNAARDGIAYSMIDLSSLDGLAQAQIVQDISDIAAVHRARLLKQTSTV